MNWNGARHGFKVPNSINTEYSDSTYYLIINNINRSIQCVTAVYEVASALLLHYPILSILAIKPGIRGNSFIELGIKPDDLNQLDVNLTYAKSGIVTGANSKVEKMSEQQVTGKHLEMRKELIACKNILELCYQAIVEVTSAETDALNGMVVRYYDTILHEYSNCNLESQYYTPGILKYASIVGLEPEDAYHALGREISTINDSRMKAVSIWDFVSRNYSSYITSGKQLEFKSKFILMLYGGTAND